MDSLEYLQIRFRRDLPAGIDKTNPPQQGSVLGVQVQGDDLLGTNLDDLFTPGFTFGATHPPTGALLVRGQAYGEVLTLASSGSVCSFCAGTKRINRLYYDRQYGIVRMESVTGEVWDRVR
ncbi:hypothetical protein [Hymenobacter coalescens]